MEDVFIKKIKIDKVRHLKDLEINLGDEKKHLIITGKNGSGKTSLLEELRDVLKDVVNNEPLEYNKKKAILYNNRSLMYQDLGFYKKALEFSLKAIEINEKTLPKDHPDLATSYNNISGIYKKLGKFDRALDLSLKDIEIKEKVLNENHPDLAISYNNLSGIYRKLGNLDNALNLQLKAIEINKKVLGENHPDLAISYNNLSLIYKDLKDFTKALEFSIKAIEINEKTLPQDHPDLATSYNNISLIYKDLKDFTKALEFSIKAIEINEKTLPKEHPDLAISYDNLSMIYLDLKDFTKALEFSLKAIKIKEKVLPKEHPDLATSYNNISGIYFGLKDFTKALEFSLKAIKIKEKVLPKNHPRLAISYDNLSGIYKKLGNSEMYDYYHKKFVQITKKLSKNKNFDDDIQSIKIEENLNDFDTNELPKLDDEDQKYLEILEKELSIYPYFNNETSIYKHFKNGEFITAFFSATRNIKFNKTESHQEIPFKSYYDIVEDNIGKNFVQYMINLKVDLMNEEKNDNEKIEKWFDTFEKGLYEIIDSKNIKLEYDKKNYKFYIIEENKEPYNLNQLSDGYSAILNIVTELMMRMEEHKTSVYDVQGVVLIDEIETHLHIELQKKILPFLTKFFPQIQFIVTTHSPFILSSLENAVAYDLEQREEITDLSAYSYDTLVEDYFDSDKFSTVLKEKVQKYEELLELKNLSDREKYEKEILEEYFDNIPKFFISDELEIKLQQLKLKELEKNN